MIATRMRQAAAGNSEVDWWLAGGITQSTNYTIYDPLAAADLAGSYVNLANPGTRNAAAPGNAPTWNATTGWTFAAASTQYLTTGAIVGPTHTMLIWAETITNSTGYAAGVFQNTPTFRQFGYRPDNSTTVRLEWGTGTSVPAPDLPGGVMCIAGNKAYRNGVDEGVTIGTWANPATTQHLYIGAQNQNGTPVTYFTGSVLRFALYDFVLNEAQVQAVTDAMLTPPTPPALNSYAATVLSTNPLAYWPMNEVIGSYVKDHTGNRRFGMALGQANGQSGQFGNAMQFTGTTASKINAGKRFTTALDLDEYSVAFWVNLNVNAALQVRLSNTYANALAEYSALEIRTGNLINAFLREGGVNQSIASDVLGTMPDETWCHIVFFNSLAGDVCGIYFNGALRETSRSVSGFVGSVDSPHPEMFMLLQGYAQHTSWYDHKLTQGEVDALYPGT